VTEEFEAGASAHLAFDHFRLVVDAFGAAVVVRERDGCGGGFDVELEAAGERVRVREVRRAGTGDPFQEPVWLAGPGSSMAANFPISVVRAFISGHAADRRPAVSRWSPGRFSGFVSRIWVALRGAMCGCSVSRRPWLM